MPTTYQNNTTGCDIEFEAKDPSDGIGQVLIRPGESRNVLADKWWSFRKQPKLTMRVYYQSQLILTVDNIEPVTGCAHYVEDGYIRGRHFRGKASAGSHLLGGENYKHKTFSITISQALNQHRQTQKRLTDTTIKHPVQDHKHQTNSTHSISRTTSRHNTHYDYERRERDRYEDQTKTKHADEVLDMIDEIKDDVDELKNVFSNIKFPVKLQDRYNALRQRRYSLTSRCDEYTTRTRLIRHEQDAFDLLQDCRRLHDDIEDYKTEAAQQVLNKINEIKDDVDELEDAFLNINFPVELQDRYNDLRQRTYSLTSGYDEYTTRTRLIRHEQNVFDLLRDCRYLHNDIEDYKTEAAQRVLDTIDEIKDEIAVTNKAISQIEFPKEIHDRYRHLNGKISSLIEKFDYYTSEVELIRNEYYVYSLLQDCRTLQKDQAGTVRKKLNELFHQYNTIIKNYSKINFPENLKHRYDKITQLCRNCFEWGKRASITQLIEHGANVLTLLTDMQQLQLDLVGFIRDQRHRQLIEAQHLAQLKQQSQAEKSKLMPLNEVIADKAPVVTTSSSFTPQFFPKPSQPELQVKIEQVLAIQPEQVKAASPNQGMGLSAFSQIYPESPRARKNTVPVQQHEHEDRIPTIIVPKH